MEAPDDGAARGQRGGDDGERGITAGDTMAADVWSIAFKEAPPPRLD